MVSYLLVLVFGVNCMVLFGLWIIWGWCVAFCALLCVLFSDSCLWRVRSHADVSFVVFFFGCILCFGCFSSMGISVQVALAQFDCSLVPVRFRCSLLLLWWCKLLLVWKFRRSLPMLFFASFLLGFVL